MEPFRKGRRITAVKRIVAILYPEDDAALLDWSRGEMRAMWGEVERESEPFAFGQTDYYHEIAPRLSRRLYSFQGLLHPEGLPSWKCSAVSMEARSAVRASSGCRRVNVDPGYLDGARIVLASTKDNAHRIYLRDDIYAEVTMCRRKSGWERFSYTFPDFQTGDYDAFFDLVREDWRRDVRFLNIKEETERLT